MDAPRITVMDIAQNASHNVNCHRGHAQSILPQTRIDELPPKLLLHIFSYLRHTELCKIARVGHAWRELAYNSQLWRSVNLRGAEQGGLTCRGGEKLLLPIVGSRFGASLNYIELPSELTVVSVLEELTKQCPRLRYLTLDFSNAMQLHDFNDLNGFPAGLYYLCICLSEVIFMEGLTRKIYHYLTPIEVLHLIGTFELSDEEEEEIFEVINISKIKSHTPNLRVINLYGISFVDDSHVELLATNCIHLQCVSLNFCIKITGSSLKVLLNKCRKIRALLLQHCGLQDEPMMDVHWEDTILSELDITSTELSSECLENVLTRIPHYRYLAVGYCDFFNDQILERLMDLGKFDRLEAIDISYTSSLSENTVIRFLRGYGYNLKGLMLQGKPLLAEYFWTNNINFIPNILTCVLGQADGWFFKLNTRVHVDQVLECFANSCPLLENLEIQWDPVTIRFSDKSRKFIDKLRLRCPHLKSLALSDGEYYEMVKANFERAERVRVVRPLTSYHTSCLSLLSDYKDLMFN